MKGEENLNGIDDPSTHTSVVLGTFDESISYEVLTYGTSIVNNTFTNNFSGKRGTALLIELVNELKVIENKFMYNGPVQTYSEIEHSPFYKHFLYNQRTLAFYLLDTESLGDCKDEASWFNQCYLEGNKIDMPQVQGALHITNCHLLETCWFVGQLPDATIDQIIQLYRPWQSVQIDNNYFYDNHANIIMFDSQEQPQASSIYI